MRFVIDEDLPRSLAPALRQAGHEVLDVRDHGLHGRSDAEVFEFAQRHKSALITADMGFANILRFPPNTHHGLIIVRFPTVVPAPTVAAQIVRSVAAIAPEELAGALAIVEPGQTRLRRPG